MKVFMIELATGKMVQVFENDWDEEDLYIGDHLHHSLCWGDCYSERDLKGIIEMRNRRKEVADKIMTEVTN